MAKKKGEYSVLYEVNTEEEWAGLCEKEVGASAGVVAMPQRGTFHAKKKCLGNGRRD